MLNRQNSLGAVEGRLQTSLQWEPVCMQSAGVSQGARVWADQSHGGKWLTASDEDGGAVGSRWSLTAPVTANGHRELWSLISAAVWPRQNGALKGEAQVNYEQWKEGITTGVANRFWQSAVIKVVVDVSLKDLNLGALNTLWMQHHWFVCMSARDNGERRRPRCDRRMMVLRSSLGCNRTLFLLFWELFAFR